MSDKKKLSFAERMKLKVKNQNKFESVYKDEGVQIKAVSCPNCGAGRAKYEGVTNCSYCDFEFISKHITNGIHLKESDNSKKQ